jgi:hypothetical protein
MSYGDRALFNGCVEAPPGAPKRYLYELTVPDGSDERQPQQARTSFFPLTLFLLPLSLALVLKNHERNTPHDHRSSEARRESSSGLFQFFFFFVIILDCRVVLIQCTGLSIGTLANPTTTAAIWR